MAEQPPSQAVTVEFSKDSCNTASGMSCSVPPAMNGPTVVLLIPGSTHGPSIAIYSNDVIHSTCENLLATKECLPVLYSNARDCI